ncbi:MAG: hypothetical protein P4N24_01375 [Acidobacteriota bacterium]|nr:hypothetical protein [Acidobacteriota bacterium]
MRKIIHFAVRLYPAPWRERYGPEFDALLEDINPEFRDLLNIVKGALLMQLKLSNIPLMATAFALLGILVTGLVSVEIPRRYASTAVIGIQAARPDELRQTLVFNVALHVLSDKPLKDIIEQDGLYANEVTRLPMADRLKRFKENITIEPLSPDAFKVSFTYPDSEKAQRVTSDLVRRIMDENLHATEQQAADKGIRNHMQMQLIDPPDQVPKGASLVEMISLGIGGGALAGVAIALLRRRFKPSH